MSTSLLDFPNEILFLIAKSLKAKDLSSLHSTSSFFATLTTPLLQRILVQDKDGIPALCWAAGKGYHGWCRLLLEKGHDANIASVGTELTPLHEAAASGHEAVIELLLRWGAAVDALDYQGETPLHYAARNCQMAAAHLLLRNNADIDAASYDSDTPLLQAIGQLVKPGYPRWPSELLPEDAVVSPRAQETAIYLLRSGADISHHNPYGENALHQAASQGCLPVLELILRISGDTDLDVQGNRGDTALHIAVAFGQEAVVRALLRRNVNIDAMNIDGNTPLHLAVEWRRKAILKILIQAGCCVNTQNVMKYTALCMAVNMGSAGMVAMILEAKPCFDLCCNAVALYIAVSAGRGDICNLLLESGANVSMDLKWAPKSQTALQRAVQRGELEIARALLRSGADIQTPDLDNKCAFCAVLENGSKDWIEMFLEAESCRATCSLHVV